MTAARPEFVPRIDLERGNVLLVGTGALGVSLLPGWIVCLREWYGWNLRTCLTYTATTMVSPLALSALCNAPVAGPNIAANGTVEHRELSQWADLIVVVPATGNFIAKFANGIADSLALTTVAFAQSPVVIVPSLSADVAAKRATVRNLRALDEDGFIVLPTAEGRSAHSGEHEVGAMPNVISAVRQISERLGEIASAAFGE